MGVVWRNRVYATSIHIMHLQMINIVIELMIWDRYWHHTAVTINCANLGLVCVVRGKRLNSLCGSVKAYNDTDIHKYVTYQGVITTENSISRVSSERPINEELLTILRSCYIWGINT